MFDFQVGAWFDTITFLGVDIEPYPNLRAWYARMEAKPYWKEA